MLEEQLRKIAGDRFKPVSIPQVPGVGVRGSHRPLVSVRGGGGGNGGNGWESSGVSGVDQLGVAAAVHSHGYDRLERLPGGPLAQQQRYGGPAYGGPAPATARFWENFSGPDYGHNQMAASERRRDTYSLTRLEQLAAQHEASVARLTLNSAPR